MKLHLASILALSTILCGVARADTISIGEASVAGFTQGSGTGQTPRGWDFLVNASGVMVTQLGVAAATNGTITLTLWDVMSQTELAQTSVTSIANTWVFGSLGSPVSLTSGQTYAVIGWQNSVTPWYLYDNTPPAAFEPTGTITYLNTRFDNGIGANTFPASTLSGQYGVTDIAYITGPAPITSVPEPGSVYLFLSGLAIVGVRRWNRERRRR